MQLPPNAVTIIYCLIKELQRRQIPWDIDIFKVVFRWEANPRLHGCFILKGRYCQVFKVRDTGFADWYKRFFFVGPCGVSFFVPRRVGEARFLGEGIGFKDPRFREVDEIRKCVHDAEDFLCELEVDLRAYKCKVLAVAPFSLFGFDTAFVLFAGQPELELGWFRIRQIGNKRVPHDQPGPSHLPAKKKVSDDPEEQCGRLEDGTGSGAKGPDSVGPSIEESGDGARDEPPRVVPEGRPDSVTRLGARAADMLDMVRRQVEQLTKEAMAQERKVKENGLLYLESESRRRLVEKRLCSTMRGLEESSRREAELQRLSEETFDQSLEETRKEGVAEFRQSLEFKVLIKEALESSVNMLGSALLDQGLVSREDLEGLDMNECILSESRSYQCPFFKMSAERMGWMFAFVSNMKVVIPPTKAEMARWWGHHDRPSIHFWQSLSSTAEI
ncbi:hypothetical protein AXF42_Ash000281 [Apostasia shenzhenica]|uniref:Uncharacterized protein n=1 Tax=Apostasia shenzhenica TaxID=1088818 RepID=A0A2I0AFZ6_9ASPA|nr:hypothetical protein AXF42_Ash000281 [Apostasia shenzhenica]